MFFFVMSLQLILMKRVKKERERGKKNVENLAYNCSVAKGIPGNLDGMQLDCSNLRNVYDNIHGVQTLRYI